MTIITEGGIRPSRIEYVPEPVQGQSPQNPAWNMPSERVTSFNPGFAISYSEDAGLGYVDYDRRPILEENELELEYALQQWFLDANGNLQDMAAYGLLRNSNVLPSSLTVVRRMESGDQSGANAPLLQPSSTVNARYNPSAASDGSTSSAKAARTYAVLKGVDVNEGSINSERGESAVMAELTCPAERGRSYHIDQPNAQTTLVLYSTNANDTGKQITIEDENAGTSETVTLDSADATVLKATTSAFADIDAIQVADENGNVVGRNGADYLGNIVIAIDEGDPSSTSYTPTEGEWLSVMWGSNKYGDTHGDEGVPLLGTGSHATAISGAGNQPQYYKPANLGIQRPPGADIEHAGGVQGLEATFENNVERTPQAGRQQIQHHGMRALESTITMFGETVSSYFQRIAMTGQGEDTRFIFDRAGNEYIDWRNAVISEIDMETEAGENSMEREATAMARRGPDDEAAVAVSNAS